MACLDMLKSTLSPISISASKHCPGKPNSRKTVLKLRTFYGISRRYYEKQQKFKVFCSVREEDNSKRNGEEPPESLFMKELKRRGMTPTSLLEETNRGNYGVEDEMRIGEEDWGFSKRNSVSTEIDKSMFNQREKSVALNSEGLEGLIPRAKLLLAIGGAFFMGVWPLILITVASFSAVYSVSYLSATPMTVICCHGSLPIHSALICLNLVLHEYFGTSFVHDGSDAPTSPPQHVDPYELLEDERISQIAPSLK